MDEMNRLYTGVGDPTDHRDILQSASKSEAPIYEPADVAYAALYLASDDAKHVNGQNTVVDGGFTAFKSLGFTIPDQMCWFFF